MAENKKRIELSEEELDNVAGGGSGYGQTLTVMVCQSENCDFEGNWMGNYRNNNLYKCPKCENITLKGTYTFNA